MSAQGQETEKNDGLEKFFADFRARFGGRSSRKAQICQDLRYLIQDLAAQKTLKEEPLRRLSAKIRDYLESLYERDISWDLVEYHEISELRDPVLEWKPVKVRALLEKMTEPMAVTLGSEKQLFTTMTFRETSEADSIDSTPTVNTELIQDLVKQRKEHHTFDVLATVVLLPGPWGPGERFYLLVHEIKPAESPLQMVRAKGPEIKEAQRTLKELKKKKRSVYEYIFETLVKGIRIQGLDDAPQLKDSLEAIIVQSFSDYWIRNASAKIHSLVIGAPAVGKKLLTEAAKCLNPVFEEAHPSKATAAGVCSTAVTQNGTWISKPGYLPLAHRGVFAIQDFHAVKDSAREKLLGVFNMVMEDGVVIDSTAARQTHPALTSIHLDTNKRTDLFPDSQLRGDTIIAKRLDDIRIPMTILSRFDFVIDIPRDAMRQKEIALAMYDWPANFQMPHNPAQQRADWARKLRVLVALLRTQHETIQFGAVPQVVRHMREKQQELWERNEEALKKIPLLSDFQARLTNSVFKFVAACTRMNNRDRPTKEDVDRAFRLINCKFQFLATLAPLLKLPGREIPGGAALEEWLRQRFSDQVKTGQVLQAFQEDFGSPAVRRTIERHLPNVAKKVRQGLWDFGKPG
jgi:hypothetical protein